MPALITSDSFGPRARSRRWSALALLVAAACRTEATSALQGPPEDAAAAMDSSPDTASPSRIDDSGGLDDGGAIMGTVVDFGTHRPLSGRKVMVDNQSVTTDALGHFTLERVPSSYDVTIVDPDGSTISVYRGLTRTDLLLAHPPSDVSDTMPFSATVQGSIAAPVPSSNGIALIYLFSEEADEHLVISNGLDTGSYDYGPLLVRWTRSNPLAASLIVLETTQDSSGTGYESWLGHRDLAPLGVPFPRGSTYRCTVAGLGTLASIDQAAGPTGLGFPFPPEIRRGYSHSVYVTTGM